jgi:predicted extracellular nuclease
VDADTLILGDFNTMGRTEAPAIAAEDEVAGLAQEIAPDFRRAEPSLACTEYFRGEGGALDHVLSSSAMQEAAAAARVTGYCAVRSCGTIDGAMPAAYETLSDHCPGVLEVSSGDLD